MLSSAGYRGVDVIRPAGERSVGYFLSGSGVFAGRFTVRWMAGRGCSGERLSNSELSGFAFAVMRENCFGARFVKGDLAISDKNLTHGTVRFVGIVRRGVALAGIRPGTC
ncbi:hypothetical protein [Nocardia tengchongensis]|uniref:hypothetical protein n=1 Tax=Nocardia tengchongensis TaxID=2055889 RepID=UPI0036465F7F